MKTLTANMATEVATNLGTEPINLIQIDWDGGTEYYADKDITIAPNTYEGKILSVTDILITGKQDQVGSIGSVTVQIDDSDGTIKTIVDSELMEGKAARLYQFFDGLVDADKLILIQGKVAGPIRWLEGQRILEFVIETAIDDQKVGFSCDTSTLPNMHEDAVDKPWPMCFGSPLRVPALQIYKGVTGVTRDNETYATSDTIYVDGGEDFPQSIPIKIGIYGPRGYDIFFGINYEIIFWFEGSFSGNVFTVTTKNAPKYDSALTFAARIASDDDYTNPSVAWLSDSTARIVNHYCYVYYGSQYMVNFCYKQEGTKCYFAKPWKENAVDTQYQLPSGSFTEIAEVAASPRTIWGATYWTEAVDHDIPHPNQTVIKDSWWISSGLRVIYEGLEVPTYVANLFESSSVSEVMAYRSIDGEKVLVPVPSSYYTITLDKSIAGQTATVIELGLQLSLREDEGWSDDLYVSLTSTKDNNAANAIKYLIDTYSDLSSDTTTFTAVAADIAQYIANFAILDQPDALSVCEDIAWQSRCALLVKNGTVYITYLSKEVAASVTFGQADIGLKSMEATFSPTEDIITRLIGNWRQEYTEEEVDYVYEDNVSDFGLVEDEREIWIYNIEILVKYTIGFWGYRYSNSWRMLSYEAFYNNLKIETFDTVAVNVAQFGGNSIRGFIEDSSINTDETSLAFKLMMASKAADYDTAGPTEDDNFWKGDPANEIDPLNPTPTDPITGRAQTDYTVSVEPGSRMGDSNNPNPVVTRTLRFSSPDSVKRSTNFTLEAEMVDQYGNRVLDSSIVDLIFTSSDGSDVLSVAQITLTDGYYSGSVQVTGGAGEDTGNVTGTVASTHEVEPTTFTINAAGKPRFEIYPDLTLRGQLFDVKIVDGPISDTVTVTLTSYDSTGDSLKTAAGAAVASVTTDANGEWEGQWKLVGGTDTQTSARISLTDAPWTYVGELIQILDVDVPTAAGVTIDVNQVGHGFSAHDAVGRLRSTGVWEAAGWDHDPIYDMKGVVVAVDGSDDFTAHVAGWYEEDLSIWGISDPIVQYLPYDAAAPGAGGMGSGTDDGDTQVPWCIESEIGRFMFPVGVSKHRGSIKILVGSNTNHATGTVVGFDIISGSLVGVVTVAHGGIIPPAGVVESTYANDAADDFDYSHVVVLKGPINYNPTDGPNYLSETPGQVTTTLPTWGKPWIILEGGGDDAGCNATCVNIHEVPWVAPALSTTIQDETDMSGGSGTYHIYLDTETDTEEEFSGRVAGSIIYELDSGSDANYWKWDWEWICTPFPGGGGGNLRATFKWTYRAVDKVAHTGDGGDSPADVLRNWREGGSTGDGDGAFTLTSPGASTVTISFSVDEGNNRLDIAITHDLGSPDIFDSFIQAHGPVFVSPTP